MKSIDLKLILEKIGDGYHFESIACYRGIILLIGDRSYPERACEWIDTLSQYELNQLIAIHDWKGGLYLFWEKLPRSYENVTDIEIPDGDVWSIYENIIVGALSEQQ